MVSSMIETYNTKCPYQLSVYSPYINIKYWNIQLNALILFITLSLSLTDPEAMAKLLWPHEKIRSYTSISLLACEVYNKYASIVYHLITIVFTYIPNVY